MEKEFTCSGDDNQGAAISFTNEAGMWPYGGITNAQAMIFWDANNFYNDIMTPYFPPQERKIFSEITASYLQDLLWYVVDFTKTEPIPLLQYGTYTPDQKCEFLNEPKCPDFATGVYQPFCTLAGHGGGEAGPPALRLLGSDEGGAGEGK